jgi:hypothetical protein
VCRQELRALGFCEQVIGRACYRRAWPFSNNVAPIYPRGVLLGWDRLQETRIYVTRRVAVRSLFGSFWESRRECDL